MPAELGLNTGLNNWQERTAEEAVSSYSPCAESPPWNPKGQAEGFSRDLRIQDRAVGGRRKHACLKQASVNGKESSEYLHDLFHVGAEREPAGSEGHQHCPCQFGQQHQPATGQHISPAELGTNCSSAILQDCSTAHRHLPQTRTQQCPCAGRTIPLPRPGWFLREIKHFKLTYPFPFSPFLKHFPSK